MAETPRHLADVVHALLMDLDPARTQSVTPEIRQLHLQQCQQSAASLTSSWSAVEPEHQRADSHLHQACTQLNHALTASTAPAQPGQWLDLRDHLSPFYEAMVTALRRHGERVPTLHPTNYRRTIFHVLSGVAVVAAFELLLTQRLAIAVAAVFCVFTWSLETARRFSPSFNVLMMKLFKPIARDHERYRVNSSTWYGTALLLIAITAPNVAGMLGILALAVGDPAAGYVGRRWGRFRIVGGKSLEGTLAFMAAALLCGLVYVGVSHHLTLISTAFLVLPAVAAVVGALTELLAIHVDDNLAVPLLTAWATLLCQQLMA